MRILLLIIAVVFGFLIIKQMINSRRRSEEKKLPETTRMVRCEHCGVHIPKQEALLDNNHYFCSDEHRKLHHS